MNGRVALVTGATGRLGAAIADRLDSDGWTVARTGRRSATLPADLADPEAAARVVRATVGEHGHLDLLVHAAATRMRGGIAEVGVADWWRVIESGLDGGFHVVLAALPHLLERQGAVILCSCEWAVSGKANATAEAAAAAGIIGLTKALAREFGTQLRVNCVAPGALAPERPDPADYPGAPVAVLERPTAVEVAATIAFLASAGAAPYRGQVFHPNGGTTLA